MPRALNSAATVFRFSNDVDNILSKMSNTYGHVLDNHGRPLFAAGRGDALGSVPLKYMELYEALRADIESGRLKSNTSCPSESALCTRFSVSRGTVRAALKRLSLEGFLQVASGKVRTILERRPLPLDKLRLATTEGSTPSFGEYLKRMGRRAGWSPEDRIINYPARVPWWKVTEASRLDASDVRKKLRLRASDEVIWLLRLRSIDGTPIVLQWVVVPATIVPHVDSAYLQPGGLTRLYQDFYGIFRHSAEANYRPTVAQRDEARLLKIDSGSPLIEEHRTSCCARLRPKGSGGRLIPYEYLVSLYTDRVSLDFSWNDRQH